MSKLKAFVIFIAGLIGFRILSELNIPPFINESETHIRSIMMGILAGVLSALSNANSPAITYSKERKWHEKLKAIVLFTLFFLPIFYAYFEVPLPRCLNYLISVTLGGLFLPYFPLNNSWKGSIDLAMLLFLGATIMYVVDRGIVQYLWG